MGGATTPAATWRVDGKPDPHGTDYDGERTTLSMGKLTDDELANGVFLHGDTRPPIQDVIDGKAFMPIVWLTAAKERIRWLSRALVKATAERDRETRVMGAACSDLGLISEALGLNPDDGGAAPILRAIEQLRDPARTVTLTGHQLLAALDLLAPGLPRDADELDDDLTFGVRQHEDDTGKVATGMCCWNDDTDGVLPLDEYPDEAPAGDTSALALVEVDAANDVIVDRRDLYDSLRAAYREGQSVGPTGEAESWSKASDYAHVTIKGWSTLRALPALVDCRRCEGRGSYAVGNRTSTGFVLGEGPCWECGGKGKVFANFAPGRPRASRAGE